MFRITAITRLNIALCPVSHKALNLDPLLFGIFINDVAATLKVFVLLFADDKKILLKLNCLIIVLVCDKKRIAKAVKIFDDRNLLKDYKIPDS